MCFGVKCTEDLVKTEAGTCVSSTVKWSCTNMKVMAEKSSYSKSNSKKKKPDYRFFSLISLGFSKQNNVVNPMGPKTGLSIHGMQITSCNTSLPKQTEVPI